MSGFVEKVQLGAAFGPEGPISVIDEFSTSPTVPNQWTALMSLDSVRLTAVSVALIIPGLVVLMFRRQQGVQKHIRCREHEQNPDTEALIGVE